MMKTSAAYDFGQFAPQEDRVRVRVVNTANIKKNSTKAFKTKLTVYFIAIMLLMSATVYSRLGLTETKGRINQQTEALKELQSENVYLSFQLENKVSLKNAEEYATNELGLIKLGSGQTEYVDLQGEDVIEKTDGSYKLAENLGSYLSVVIEFFGG